MVWIRRQTRQYEIKQMLRIRRPHHCRVCTGAEMDMMLWCVVSYLLHFRIETDKKATRKLVTATQ